MDAHYKSSQKPYATPKIGERLLLIGGVRKSGTSTLFHTIADHPQVSTTWMKEPQFLALHPDVVRNNLHWYVNLFENHRDGQVMLDGSTWCFTSPWTASILRRFFEQPRVILLIRDPAKRAYSGYLHMHKQVPCADSRSFDEILNKVERASNTKSLSVAENGVLKEAIAAGKVEKSYRTTNFHRERADASFDTKLDDMQVEFKYFQESCYSNYLPRFERRLGDDLMVVVLEELIAHPQQVLQDIFEFAQLSVDGSNLELRYENRTHLPRNRFTRTLMEARTKFPILDATARLLKSLGLRRLGRQFRLKCLRQSKPKISEDQYQRARQLLKSEYNYWADRRPVTRDYWQIEK